MNFELTDRAKEYLERVNAFMDERIYPTEPFYEAQMHESGDPNFHPPVVEEPVPEEDEPWPDVPLPVAPVLEVELPVPEV